MPGAIPAHIALNKIVSNAADSLAFLQDEVDALARKELGNRAGLLPSSTSASASSGDSTAQAALDPQATIDELRADIAYARAAIQQIKAAQVQSDA